MPPSAAPAVVSIRELPHARDAIEVYDRLRGEGLPWLLDSALADAERGRFSFVGADPYLVLRAFGRRVELERRRDVRPDLRGCALGLTGDPLEIARSLLPRCSQTFDGPPFCGGAVGWWGYELGAFCEPVALHGRDDLGLPDLALLFVDRLIAIDHLESRGYAIGLGFGSDPVRARASADEARDRVAALAARAGGGAPPAATRRARREVLDTHLPADTRCQLDEAGYESAVREIQRDIEAGNVYQANLTQRMERPFSGDALVLYRALRELNPAPFAALLELPEVAVASSSPERFVRVDPGGEVESRPIKGTRPRGRTPDEDARLASALSTCEKDRAENLMIVDLVRNDLGRVCETGSIAVPELMEVEAYASVFQMVSTVTGRLAPGRDVTDLLRASFPPGSMTGAPKIAAMRIIDRHETVRRGIYSGAIGYLDVRGGADLSVVIRTILLHRGRAVLHAGGAVVADSDPAAEYRECLDKARALFAALAVAERDAARGASALRAPEPPWAAGGALG